MEILQAVPLTDTIINKVTFLIAFAMSWFGLIKVVKAWAEENSVGKKALGEVALKAGKMEKDIDVLARQVEECAEDNQELKKSVHELSDDFKEMIKTTLQYYQNRR